MKKLSILLILAIFLGVGMIGAMPGVSQAQVVSSPLCWPQYPLGLLQR